MTRRHAGFSLFELLVAMSIGTVVTAGAFAGLARARTTWAAAEIENRLHERAQYAFATLEVELQMAGYFAGANPSPLAGSALQDNSTTCGAAVFARLDRPVESAEAYYPYRCAPQGNGHRESTDVLLVHRTSAKLADSATGRIRWLSCHTPACTSGLLGQGTPAPPAAPPAAEVRDLMVRIFYVSRAADGDPATPALRVKSLSAIAGVPAFIDTEVMPGVDDLQITIEPDTEGPQTVHVSLGVRADAADQRSGEPLRRLTVTRQFALRNATRPAT